MRSWIAVAAFMLATTAASAQRRTLPRPRWRASITVAAPSTLLGDGNGTIVRTMFGPGAAAGLAWKTHGMRAGLDLGASLASVQLSDQGRDWSGGRSMTLEGSAWLSRTLFARVAGEAAIGMLRLAGPDDVSPFRFQGASALHPFARGTVLLHPWTARPFSILLGATAFQLGAETSGDPVRSPGTVTRATVGVCRGC